ncbi:MAG: hypothetical protein ACE5J2_09115 [Nitrososphaerales archaeon]
MLDFALIAGLMLGVKHALEPDHIATVVTMGHHYRKYVVVGALWSAGHAGMILLVAMLLNIAGFNISVILPLSWEVLTGIAMVVMGVFTLKTWHIHPHFHGLKLHIHLHRHASGDDHHSRYEHKPLMFGMLHGLAGSGVAIILFANNMLFLLVFSAGTIIAMLGVMAVVRTVFSKVRFDNMRLVLAGISIAIGIMLIIGRSL